MVAVFFADVFVASTLRNSAGTRVLGVIDGKIDVGYLVTVMLGFDQLKGVIYQIPQDLPQEMPQYQSAGYKINDSEAPGRAVSTPFCYKRRVCVEPLKSQPFCILPNNHCSIFTY